MRLIRITTNYPSYLKQFYQQHPELETQPYAQQYQTLLADCFGWADFWTHAFNQLGYEVWEPVGNAEPMQKIWAKEQGVNYHEKTWLTDIITAQVKQFKPNIVLVNDYITYNAEFFRDLRSECPSIKLIIGWCGAPFTDATVFNAYDLVLSNIPSLVTYFRENNHKSEYLCHAFEPRILAKLKHNSEKSIPFSFVGSLSKSKGYHHERENLLKKLVQETDLQLWLEINQPSAKERKILPLKQQVYDWIQLAKYIPGSQFILPNLPKIKKMVKMKQRPELPEEIDHILIKQAHSSLFGMVMYQQLYQSKVTLNTHIDIAEKFASNMRLYEATGVGTCLLTDWKDNLSELFEPDVEVVTYRSAEEAIDKVGYLLNNEETRKAIAKAGQARTLRDHTYVKRAIQLDKMIQKFNSA